MLRLRLLPGLAAVIALGAAAPASGAVQTVSRGALTARFSFHRHGDYEYRDLRLTVLRHGRRVYAAPVHVSGCEEPYCAPGGFGSHPGLRIADVDGDGRRDVVVDVFTGGAHCCLASQLVLLPAGSPPEVDQHTWGDPGYKLTDVGGDGRKEFLTSDDRFAYAFTAYAYSALPVQILTYGDGGWTDVTRRHRAVVRLDARYWMESYRRTRARAYPQAELAAWAADRYLLGHRRDALRFVGGQARHGKLRRALGARRAARWPGRMDRRLRRWGY